MFNLIMINTDWKETDTKNLDSDRFLESPYTEPHIKQQYTTTEGKINIDSLKNLPTVFMNEGYDKLAYLGELKEIQLNSTNVFIEHSLYSEIPPIMNEIFFEKHMEIKMGQWQWQDSRHYWAIKNADLHLFWLKNVHPMRQNPKVFRLSQYEDIEPYLVSAMMPFKSTFKPVFEAMEKACENLGLKCTRADDNDNWEQPIAFQNVVNLIDKSSVVIFDLSEENPNVFYEMGIANTLGKEIVIITQDEKYVPFDIQHLLYIKYEKNETGLEKLTHEIANRINKIRNKS